MEYLDYYDENGNYIGKEDRAIVHKDALWHNTVHCWLYDKAGNVFFQIRKDEEKLYTTASGHVISGESIKEGFGREIKEEIGIDVNYNEASLVEINKFVMDKVKKDGSLFRDRAFANVYACDFEGQISEFNFDESEIIGLVKVSARDALSLFEKGEGSIKGTVIKKNEDGNTCHDRDINLNEFLVNKGETAIGKYGNVLNHIIMLSKN